MLRVIGKVSRNLQPVTRNKSLIKHGVSCIVFSIVIVITCCSIVANAQNLENSITMTLTEVVERAKIHSPDAGSANNRFKNSYWKYKSYKANYRPLVDLSATAPDINRSISRITLDDGSEAFIETSSANSNLNLNVSQNVGFTGGNVFLSSNLQRIDLIGNNKSTSYLTTPIQIGYTQPLFSFNNWRWQQKIEPLLFEEAQRKYIEDIEGVAVNATNLYFDLLRAAINLDIAIMNKANNDMLYKITQGRYNLGKIAENELLQMELSVLNSNIALAQSKLELQTSTLKLKSFLGLKDISKIELINPRDIPDFQVDVDKAIELAKQNSQEMLGYRRQLIEADRDVLKAKRENRFDVQLYATYGLTQSSNDLNDLYSNPNDQERFRLGIQLPIFDWGRSKAQIKMAEANSDLLRTNTEQQMLDYDQSIYLKVMQFNMQRDQLYIAQKADTIAQKRYEVTKQRYLIGKIVITDLNIALAEKDQSKRSFVESLRNFWVNYYELRRTTHYDFEQNAKIEYKEPVE
ncbi:MAG: hypothetical protein COC01_04005 [Bacteroidetes bacterium]|nr:MAG: hypothetical protein COC01_04005 [Bacteroidota bacterium]